jgi:Tol biopolymer transport system component
MRLSHLARTHRVSMPLVGPLLIVSGACGGDLVIPGPTGSVEVVTVTAGETLDPDGYALAIDGIITTTAIGVNEALLMDLAVGVRQVELTGTALNCQVAGENPRTVTVTEGATASVRFEVACAYVLREIVFSASRQSPYCSGFLRQCDDVYIMSADGVSPKKLTDGGNFRDDQPVWSPDGRSIVFTRSDGSSQSLHLMSADGSGVRALTAGPADSEPAWSPDGDRIAFNRGGDIYVLDADGSNLVNLTPHSPGASDPAWSPDGSRIAFAGRRVSGGCRGELWACFDIRVMDADGGNPQTLNITGFHDTQPAWSPDGSIILFTREEEDPHGWWTTPNVYVMNADGTGVIPLTGGAGGSEPAWSPDGRRIAFSGIVVMNADGSDPVSLTDQWGSSPAWLPTAPGPEAER